MNFHSPSNAKSVQLLLNCRFTPFNPKYPQCIRPVLRNCPAIIRHGHRHRSNARFASTSREIAADATSLVTRLKNLFLGTSFGLLVAFGYYYVTDTRASVHQWLAVPSLRWIYDDAEEAHEAGTKALKALYEFGLYPRERGKGDAAGDLEVEIFGHKLPNPIGISAGLDKGAEIPSPLFSLGAALVEVGGVTPHPQKGNPKPRVFRLPSQRAMINRYGLNSEGADHIAMRLRERVRRYAYAAGLGIDEVAEQRVLDGEAGVPPGSLVEGKLMAVQVAKNTTTPDDDVEAVKADIVYCVEALARYADIIVVNISCPNVTGSGHQAESLSDILTSVVEATKKTNRKMKPAVMVKVSPDEDSESQVMSISDAVLDSGVDGVIVSNTTRRRPDPTPQGLDFPRREAALMAEQGGYSGPQLFDRTVALVAKYRAVLDGDLYRKPGSGSTPKTEATQQQPFEPNPLPTDTSKPLTEQIEASIQRDKNNLKASNEEKANESKSQPLIRRNNPFSEPPDSNAAAPASTPLDQLHEPQPDVPSQPISNSRTDPASPQPSQADTRRRKVIFASGGISNGKQVLEVLEAGAQLAMMYTSIVYGGVGTITSVKDELREEMRKVGRGVDIGGKGEKG